MEKQRNKIGKRMLILILILGGIFTFFSIYNKIDTVKVKGCQYYSEEEIKEQLLSGIEDKNSVFLYIKARYIGLKELPYIEKVTVKRESNHVVTLRVYEKALVACVKYMGQYLYFDKDGKILNTSEDLLDGVPVISGLTFSGFKMYEMLEVEERSIFSTILDISQIINRYQILIDKIHFNCKNEVSLTVGDIIVYLGKRKFYDEPIAALSEILPIAQKKKLIGTINMENYEVGDKVIFQSQSKK